MKEIVQLVQGLSFLFMQKPTKTILENWKGFKKQVCYCFRRDVSDVNMILTAPETQDEGVWKYEHLRQFSMELNGLAVALQSQCQPETCTQMTATEQWIFLVSV